MKRCTGFLLLLLSGAFADAQPAFYISAGATVVSTGGATIVDNGLNLYNHGNFQQATGAVLKFTGSTGMVFSRVTPGITYLDQLVLQLDPAAAVSLQEDISIATALVFNGGLLNLNSNKVDLGKTGLLLNESEASRAFTTGTGYIQWQSDHNGGASFNGGNLGAVITSPIDLGLLTIRRGHLPQTNLYGGGSSIKRYYDILPTNNTALNASLRINYFDAETNGLNENALVVYKSNDGGGVWTAAGYDSRDALLNYVEKTGINNFSRFTLSTAFNALPLTWVSFTGYCNGSGVALHWATDNEKFILSYTVEQSSDGLGWQPAGTVIPANRPGQQQYAFQSPGSSAPGYYRVAEKDLDGHIHYSSVLRFLCNPGERMDVFPNPARGAVTVAISAVAAAPVRLLVYDNRGVLVQEARQILQPGLNQIKVDLGAVAQGMYTIVAAWNKQVMQKMVVRE